MYLLTIEKDGFKRTQRAGLVIAVNEAATLDVSLAIGGVSETVTVKAEAQIVQSQTSNVSQLITEQRLQDLPLNSKDFQRLTFLAPGVGGQRGNNSSTNYSVSGARDAANNNGPFFTSDRRSKVPPFKQNLFGGTLGGPMTLPRFGEGSAALQRYRDKHFFFASYEGFRQRQQQTASTVLPNAELKAWSACCCT